MAVFAPLIRGGNRALPLMILELVALAGLFIALVPASMRRRIPPAAAIVAGLAAAIPLLGLLPLPPALWSAIPGRGAFADALALSGDGERWRALSLAPFETEFSGLALLPPLATFFLALTLTAERLRALTRVIVLVAVIEAVLGLLQYGAAGGQLADFRASGTYVNPNHFAGLMLMALPLALMSLALDVGERLRSRRFTKGVVDAAKRMFAAKGTRVMLWLFAIVLILLALMFSRSRAGIAIGAAGIAITALVVAPRVGGPRAYGAVGVGITLALGAALAIGFVPVLDRFGVQDTVEAGRGAIFAGALDMAGSYFPFGSGMGTFATLYPPFQPTDITALIHRAHNDYIEWLVEGGVLAALAIVAGFALYVARVVMLLRLPEKDATHALQLAAAVSVLLIAAHGMVDFNFRIPANALIFAMLAGVVVARRGEREEATEHEHREVIPRPARSTVAAAAPVPAYTNAEEAERVRAAWTTAPTSVEPAPHGGGVPPAHVPTSSATLDGRAPAETPRAPTRGSD
ncbi:MAG: O-antigen ligase family protein [Proteobacteria bacterium]|nr:O-antigen ligase family protein [Pseudomonadota bacterium]